MRETIKKIAYLKGLCEGYGFDENSKEGVILKGILDVLDGMADDVMNVVEMLDNISDFMDDGDFDDDEDLDECGECGDDEEYSYAFICPSCGQELEVDEEILENEEELTCPACGNVIPVLNEFADFDEEQE